MLRINQAFSSLCRPGASPLVPEPPHDLYHPRRDESRQPQFADPSKRTTYLRIAVLSHVFVMLRAGTQNAVSDVGGRVSRRVVTQSTRQHPNTSFTSPCDVFMVFLRRRPSILEAGSVSVQCCETTTPAGSSEEPDAPASAVGGCAWRCAKNPSTDCMTASVALFRHSGDRSSAASFGLDR